jgi:hypothetical protein
MAPLILRRSRQRNQHPDGGHIEHRAGAKIEWTRVLGEESRKTRGRGKKSPGDKKVCRVFGGDHVESEVVSMDPCVAFPMRDRLGELVNIL